MVFPTLRLAAAGLLLTLGLLAAGASQARAEETPESVLLNARATLQDLVTDPHHPSLTTYLSRARAVLIFPSVFKGAFLVGGEGGDGVLLVKNPNGIWSEPAFYSMGSASIGFQVGGQVSRVMLIVLTDEGLDSILRDKVKLGADIGLAAGPAGLGGEAATTTNVGQDIIAFQNNQGLYAGMSLSGAVLQPKRHWNQAFYGGHQVTVRDVVMEGMVTNPKSAPLRQALSRY